MTPEQIELLQTTFAMIVPIKEEAGKLFYGRLFELDPTVRPIFPDELDE